MGLLFPVDSTGHSNVTRIARLTGRKRPAVKTRIVRNRPFTILDKALLSIFAARMSDHRTTFHQLIEAFVVHTVVFQLENQIKCVF
jgi:hypothetical protein